MFEEQFEDDTDLSIQEQIEEEMNDAYNYGVKLWEKEKAKNPEKEPKIIIECDWCGKKAFEFGWVTGFVCNECGYTPGASLEGGQFS